MLDFMEGYYDKMRNEMQLQENYDQGEEEPQLAFVLKTLRPNTTSQNFKDYLKSGQNFNKS